MEPQRILVRELGVAARLLALVAGVVALAALATDWLVAHEVLVAAARPRRGRCRVRTVPG